MAEYGQYEIPQDILHLGIGQPGDPALGFDLSKEAWRHQAEHQTNPKVSQYGAIPGYPRFRESLAGFLQRQYQEEVNPEDLFVTTGITGGLNRLYQLFGGAPSKKVGPRKMFGQSKTKVLVENPTYFLALDLFQDFSYEVEYVKVPMQEDGANLEVVERQLQQLKPDEKIIFYTIPCFHNPTSYTMSHEKRQRLGQLADEWAGRFLVIADEVYQLLYFSEDTRPPLPLCYYSPEIVSLGSCSKALSPGIRKGWMQTRNSEVIHRWMNCAYLDSAGGDSPHTSLELESIIQGGRWPSHLEKVREYLRTRCQRLRENLNLPPEVKVSQPTGGYFLWLECPESVDTREMLELAPSYGVKFLPGSRFTIDGSLSNFLRLSFSVYSLDQLAEAGQRLSKLMHDFMTPSLPLTRHLHLMGARGRLGSLIRAQLESRELEFSEVTRDQPLALCEGRENLVLDVSSPEGTNEVLSRLIELGATVPVVIGTTGDLPQAKILSYARTAPVAVISNFSYGIPQMARWLGEMDPSVWSAHLKETHHRHKKDAPSGTALRLREKLVGAEQVAIESIRHGEVFGKHTAILETPHERLEITHEAKTREIFAEGTLRYLEWIRTKGPGVYTEMDLMEDQQRSEGVTYSKYTGSGNDFIIVARTEMPSKDWSHWAQQWCRRALGIGADGLIVVDLNYGEGYVAQWQYHNSDGSLVEMCGNGSRCVAHWVAQRTGHYTGHLINNFGVVQSYWVTGNQVRIRMPDPECRGEEELVEGILYEPWTVGVPHLVTEVSSLSEWPRITTDQIYHRVERSLGSQNINWVQVIQSESSDHPHLRIRTRERGAGQTLACGTGCCASALYLLKHSLKPLTPKIGQSVTLTFQADSQELLRVVVSRQETPEGEQIQCYLEGTVRKVASGKIEPDSAI